MVEELVFGFRRKEGQMNTAPTPPPPKKKDSESFLPIGHGSEGPVLGIKSRLIHVT